MPSSAGLTSGPAPRFLPAQGTTGQNQERPRFRAGKTATKASLWWLSLWRNADTLQLTPRPNKGELSPSVPHSRALLDAVRDPIFVIAGATLRWANRSAAGLLGFAPEALEEQPLSTVFGSEERALLEARLSAPSEELLRLTLRCADGSPLSLDLRLGDAGDGTMVLHGQHIAPPAHRDALAQLSTLHERNADADLPTILRDAAAAFSALGWHTGLWEIQGPTVTLCFRSANTPETPFGARLWQRRIPFADAPGLAEVARTRKGAFVPGLSRLSTNLAEAIGTDPKEVEQLHEDHGMHRGIFAPVIIDDRVTHVLSVVGSGLNERDLASVQLFTAMLSAASNVKSLSEEMGRQRQHATLGQMAAQLAHEVRNPLAVVLQAARNIRRRREDAEATETLVGMIEEEGKRLERLVADLVHFAGPLRPRVHKVHLEQVVHWALDMVLVELPKHCAQVTVEVHVSPDQLVLADAVLLRQAVAHLLVNACEHAGKGGKVDVSGHVRGDEVELRVCNTGEPLAPELAARVFEPFFTTRAAGSGLGLAVVRRLVQDQGGRVVLQTASEDTTFSVFLPLADGDDL